jgi:hypothetical protein
MPAPGGTYVVRGALGLAAEEEYSFTTVVDHASQSRSVLGAVAI